MKRKEWDIHYFDMVNLPEPIGQLQQQISFSEPRNIRVLDLPIFMPEQGWKVPDPIRQFQEMIDLCVKSESRYGDFEKDHYVYITVDQKLVAPGKTGRRPGAHSDAYLEVDNRQLDIKTENRDAIVKSSLEISHTYIAYDAIPTEFFLSCFPLHASDCVSSLKTFDEIAEQSATITYPPYTVLKLDPYVIHRSAVAASETYRTFVKISVSKKKYARIGNTLNPEFEYSWAMSARSPEHRNHPWS